MLRRYRAAYGDRLRCVRQNYYQGDETGEKRKELKIMLTFEGLIKCLDESTDVYKYFGVGDSVIRERLFSELAKMLGVKYDFIFDKWLDPVKLSQKIEHLEKLGGETQ